MPGILPRVPMKVVKNQLVLTLPQDLAPLANERVQGRLKTLARIIGREPLIRVK